MTIDYQNIDIYQGEHRVLANVCFQVEEGEIPPEGLPEHAPVTTEGGED